MKVAVAIVSLIVGLILIWKTASPNTREFPMTHRMWAGQIIGIIFLLVAAVMFGILMSPGS